MAIHRYTQYMYSYPHKTAYRYLEGIRLENYISRLSGQSNGVYFHIPFCETKCGYCNLFSVTGQAKEKLESYLDAVERQLMQYHELLKNQLIHFSEITIGGGTPLLLPVEYLERLFSRMKSYLCLGQEPKIIVETAPNQTDTEKLTFLKEMGVTRVSMGIQSFFDTELKALRRMHRVSQAEKALRQLKDKKFSCINVDLIYGVPGQTEQSFLESVKRAAAFEPEELFLYPLYIKHGVALERELKNGMVLDEELAYRQYRLACDYLVRQGYRQDSMRRFVKTEEGNREFSRCGFGSVLSFGCGGRSYIGNLHFCTPYAVGQAECLKQLEDYLHTSDYRQITHGFLLNEEEEKRRYVIRHLLIRPGICEKDYQRQFNRKVLFDFPILSQWIDQKLIQEEKDMLCLTEEGLALSDYLGPQLISENVMARMKEWEITYGT